MEGEVGDPDESMDAGFKNASGLPREKTMTFSAAVSYVVVALVIGAAAWKASTTSLLKDPSDAHVPPYSLSRSQLLWWTVIVASCATLHYALTGEPPTFTANILVLMGISAGTAGTAGIIDQRQDAASALSGKPRSQDCNSEGWFTDVLSDNSGVSVHRFQIVAFNFIYGVIFISKFLSDSNHDLPEFDPFTLGLLGISASTYAVMKGGENKALPNRSEGAEALTDDGFVG